jgi:hypothetical protein
MVIFSRATSHSSGTYTGKEETGIETGMETCSHTEGSFGEKFRAEECKMPFPKTHKGAEDMASFKMSPHAAELSKTIWCGVDNSKSLRISR